VTEGEKARLIAWSQELRRVHARLREALKVTREAVGDSRRGAQAGRDLLLFCHGFCTALTGHHEGEDRELFPAVAAAHPELRRVLRLLERDHAMIASLLSALRAAVDAAAGPDDLDRHLSGIAAIMENHFRYEEDQLLRVLGTLALDVSPAQALGPL
jgi:hemerythrin-like domain-containing protein